MTMFFVILIIMPSYLDTQVRYYEDKASYTDTRHLYKYNKEVDAYILKAAIKRLEAVFKRSLHYHKDLQKK